MAKKSIPQLKSYEEEAAFWDTHDATDYFTFERVKLSKGIADAADPPSRPNGRGPSEASPEPVEGTLIRMWIKENVKARNPRARQPK